MNSTSHKLIVLMLMMFAALMSAPGLGWSIAKAQLHDTEAPSQSVEKLEFTEVGIDRQNRRIRFRGLRELEPRRVRFEQGYKAVVNRRSIQCSITHAPARLGHRLPNGLLAPLRI